MDTFGTIWVTFTIIATIICVIMWLAKVCQKTQNFVNEQIKKPEDKTSTDLINEQIKKSEDKSSYREKASSIQLYYQKCTFKQKCFNGIEICSPIELDFNKEFKIEGNDRSKEIALLQSIVDKLNNSHIITINDYNDFVLNEVGKCIHGHEFLHTGNIIESALNGIPGENIILKRIINFFINFYLLFPFCGLLTFWDDYEYELCNMSSNKEDEENYSELFSYINKLKTAFRVNQDQLLLGIYKHTAKPEIVDLFIVEENKTYPFITVFIGISKAAQNLTYQIELTFFDENGNEIITGHNAEDRFKSPVLCDSDPGGYGYAVTIFGLRNVRDVKGQLLFI